MKCDAGIAVLQVDDAAAMEAVFLQGTLHRDVVPVGIDPQIGAFREGEIVAKARHTPAVPCHRNSMDHPVRLIVEPTAVIDHIVGRIVMAKEAENTQNFPIFYAQPALPRPNIFPNSFF